MKVIFLDIDGVLATWRSIAQPRCRFDGAYLTRLDSRCVAALNDLVDRSGAQIVLSSTWRRVYALSTLRGYFAHEGVAAHLIGRTPIATTTTSSMPRGVEIAHWLAHARKPVDGFVILDDESDMATLRDRLVQTNMTTGLTADHVERALSLLADPAA